MSTTFQTRLKDASTTAAQIRPLIDRLHNFTASVGQGDQARLELAAEIHARIKEVEEEMELLKDEANAMDIGGENRRRGVDSEKEAEKERMVSMTEKLMMDLKGFVCFRLRVWFDMLMFVGWQDTGRLSKCPITSEEECRSCETERERASILPESYR